MGAAQWLYTTGIVLVLVALIFDRQVHSLFERVSLGRAMGNIEDEVKAEALAKYREAFERWQKDPTNFNKRIK